VGAGVVERGEINGDIVEHEGPKSALFPCFVEDDRERGDLPRKYGDGGGYLKDEVCTCKTGMVGSSKYELDEKNRDESESDAGKEDLYRKRASKNGAIGKIRVDRITTVNGRVSERIKVWGREGVITHDQSGQSSTWLSLYPSLPLSLGSKSWLSWPSWLASIPSLPRVSVNSLNSDLETKHVQIFFRLAFTPFSPRTTHAFY
jgi:hypothetical protein